MHAMQPKEEEREETITRTMTTTIAAAATANQCNKLHSKQWKKVKK